MTAHSSKGLGYDDVIIINGKNETYGFPSKIEDDSVLAFVIKGDRAVDYAEERRLFYVAMTRTKNRVYFVAPESNPSEFLLEIKKEYKNVKLSGSWNEEEVVKTGRKPCPLCGYPLQLKYKRAYGLRLYICTNEPEICGFMTNDCRAGKLSILKCDKCRDGYLIVKRGKYDDFFLGCTNYKQDGTGCDKVISRKYFYDQMNYTLEAVDSAEAKPSEYENVAMIEKIDKKTKIFQGTTGAGFFDKTAPDDDVIIKKADIKPVMLNDKNLNEVVFITLKALQSISAVRFYGVTMLTDFLQGLETERIVKNKLNALSEFGLLKEMSRDNVQATIEWLISQHMILKTKEGYPVLHITYAGMHYADIITSGKLNKLKQYIEDDR